MIEVIAAAEPVPMVTGDLARLARHNRRRHTPCHQGRGDRWLSASNQFVCSTLRRGRTSSANAGRGWRSLIRWWSTRPIARLMGGRPYVMARLRRSEGVDEVVGFLVHEGGCQTPSPDIHADRKATILSEEKFLYENFCVPKIFRTKNLRRPVFNRAIAIGNRHIMGQGATLSK